jgi:hypothetical protein
MFCSVEIPGRAMKDVYRLPSWAVSYENTVYAAVEDSSGEENEAAGYRLKTVPVEVVREEGDHKYVSTGLKSGDLVVITRLMNPLEGTLLKISEAPTQLAAREEAAE